MSEQTRMSDLPLFAPPPVSSSTVATAHDRAETVHAAFLTRVRLLLAGIYARTGIEVTADTAHEVMEKYRIRIPPGASPNLMGTLFSGWPRARSTGRMVRSKREGANGNPILVWLID